MWLWPRSGNTAWPVTADDVETEQSALVLQRDLGLGVMDADKAQWWWRPLAGDPPGMCVTPAGPVGWETFTF